jgi:MFS family permease
LATSLGTTLQGQPPSGRGTAALEPTPIAAWTTLSILLIFFLLSFADKQMMSLLANAMSQSLKLRDAELGLLVGAAFGIFYTFSVLGAGYLVDRYSKRMILFIAVMGWSLAAAGTGLANSFGSLFVARALVGIGEGFLPPASFALIALVFPRHKVATATGIFFGGSGAGAVLAFAAGGKAITMLNHAGGATFPLVGHLEAWRSAFLISALPGVPIALLAFFLRTKPASKVDVVQAALPQNKEGYWEFLRLRKALILRHNFAFGMNSAACYAVLFWSPAFLERVFHWKSDRIGLVLAAGSIASILGNVGWGWVADVLKRRGSQDALYRVYPLLYVGCIPATAITFTTLTPEWFIVGYLLVAILLLGSGGLTAAMQLSTPSHLRGRIVGLQTLASGIFGLALSPTLVPTLTDFVFHDRQAIGLAITVVVAVAASIAIALLCWGRRPLREAIMAQEQAAVIAAARQ